MKTATKRGLLALVLAAFGLRALFMVYGAPVYYGLPAPMCYSFGDAISYMWAAENLIDKGHYIFDFLEPDTAFGRLPGYPLFYGLHYLLFGPVRAIYATAWSQVVLDSLTVLLVFAIVRRLAPRSRSAPWVGAALYASYPFIIFWAPMIYTELLATDLMLLLFYALLRYASSGRAAFGLGLLVAAGLFTREYLFFFLPIALLWVVWYNGGLARRAAWTAATLVGLGFVSLYALWPIRNYLSYHRIEFIKPKTTGYASHKEDLHEYRSWVHAWTNDENPWIAKIAEGTGPIAFPAHVFANATEAARAQQLVTLARECGSSFFMQREAAGSTHYGLAQEKAAAAAHLPITGADGQPIYRSIYTVYRDTAFMMHDSTYLHFRNHNCNAEIGEGFRQLRQSYARQHPASYWLAVPAANLFKAFFKSSTATRLGGAKDLAIRGLFAYRSLLLLLGVLALWVYRRERAMWPVAMFVGGMVFFVCFLMRNLEMRYLLQADVLLLLPAAVLLGEWADRLRARRQRLLVPSLLAKAA